MTSAIYDFKAIKAATFAFADTPPQNVVEPPAEKPTHVWSEEHHCYVLSSDDQPDYGMYAGFVVPTPVGDDVPIYMMASPGETVTVTPKYRLLPPDEAEALQFTEEQLLDGEFIITKEVLVDEHGAHHVVQTRVLRRIDV